MSHRCTRCKNESSGGFEVSFGVTEKMAKRMLESEIEALDCEESTSNSLSFLSSHSDDVTFCGEFIVRGNFLVISTV